MQVVALFQGKQLLWQLIIFIRVMSLGKIRDVSKNFEIGYIQFIICSSSLVLVYILPILLKNSGAKLSHEYILNVIYILTINSVQETTNSVLKELQIHLNKSGLKKDTSLYLILALNKRIRLGFVSFLLQSILPTDLPMDTFSTGFQHVELGLYQNSVL